MAAKANERLDIPLLLGRLPLFQELAPEHVAQIADATREKRFAKGEVLFQKGTMPRGLYVIVFGQIKLAFPSSQGNEKVVDILGPKQSFGEAVMFMDQPYPVFAEALVESLLLHISKSAIFDLLATDTYFARRMLAGLSKRVRSLVSDVESYLLSSSAQRVIGYLLQHFDDRGCAVGSTKISLPTSKQVIASRLNLTPETLSRIFNELAKEGLIDVHGKEVLLKDLCRLREYEL